MGDVPIVQDQPSNGDPKKAYKDTWTNNNTGSHGALAQGEGVREIQWCI